MHAALPYHVSAMLACCGGWHFVLVAFLPLVSQRGFMSAGRMRGGRVYLPRTPCRFGHVVWRVDRAAAAVFDEESRIARYLL